MARPGRFRRLLTAALANPEVYEQEVARDLFEIEPHLVRPGRRPILKPLRQRTESVNDALQGNW